MIDGIASVPRKRRSGDGWPTHKGKRRKASRIAKFKAHQLREQLQYHRPLSPGDCTQ